MSRRLTSRLVLHRFRLELTAVTLITLVFSGAALAQDVFPRVLRFPAGESPGSIAIAGRDTGRSRASCCAAVGVRARVGPAVMGGTVLFVLRTDPGRCGRPRSLAPG